MDNALKNTEEKNWVIVKCIEKWMLENDETEYNTYCTTFNQNSILTNVDTKTLHRFLYTWGRMGRVLGQDKYSGWEEKVKALITLNCDELNDLKKTSLTKVNIEEYEKEIKKYYRSFAEILGPIAAVKTMHLICPSFFPLWDNPIAAAFRNERVTAEKIASFSDEDYYQFMKEVKDIAIEYRTTILNLSAKYGVSELRLIDQFAWWISHRPLSLLF